MYDPGIGRWLSEDPIGFSAGDSNLYRYANNEPTNRTDPSGLVSTPQIRRVIEANGLQREIGRLIYDPRESVEAFALRFRQNQPLGNGFPCQIHFCDAVNTIQQIAQRIIIREDLAGAGTRIAKARDALENHFAAVRRDFADDGRFFVLFGRGVPTEANRRFYIDALGSVLRRLRDPSGVVNINLNETDPFFGEGGAYVRWLGDTIYINPRFFRTLMAGEAQEIVISHELARLIPGITGNANQADGSTNNVWNWDAIVHELSNKDY